MSQIHVPASSEPPPPEVPTSFVTDSGTVVAALNIINVNGDPGVQVIANPNGSNNMLIKLDEVSPSYVNVTNAMSPYTVLSTDYFISCDSSTGPITIRLLNSPTQYQQFIVKDRTGNAAASPVTVTTAGGVVTIDGSISQTFVDPYESLELLFNGVSYESF